MDPTILFVDLENLYFINPTSMLGLVALRMCIRTVECPNNPIDVMR